MTEPLTTAEGRHAATGEPAPGNDRRAAALAVLGFSTSLGAGQLALPLLALVAGYDPAAVGIFAAVSAVGQLGFRLALPWLLGRFPDRNLLGVASLAMVASYSVLLLSTALPAFLFAQLLNGSARALFWTASQTHAIRGAHAAVNALARVQVVGNIGTLSGPAIAGVLSGISIDLALAFGIVTGAMGLAASRAMHRLPPFVRERRPGESSVWRRTGVDVGCWASFTAGGWRAMLGSYFPVVLTSAGLGPTLVGAFVALADGASFAAAAILVRYTPSTSRGLIEGAVVATSLGIIGLPLVAGEPLLAAALIFFGGAGAGFLLTFGPAVASDAVAPNERGDAIAIAGTFRAAALLATPAGVAVGLSLVTLPVGMAVAGIGLGLPALATGIRARLAAARTVG